MNSLLCRLEACLADVVSCFLTSSLAWQMCTMSDTIRMKKEPFSSGSLRLAYYVEWNGRKYVAKESKNTTPDENCERYFLQDIHMQLRAKDLADRFMVSVQNLARPSVPFPCDDPHSRVPIALPRCIPLFRRISTTSSPSYCTSRIGPIRCVACLPWSRFFKANS